MAVIIDIMNRKDARWIGRYRIEVYVKIEEGYVEYVFSRDVSDSITYF